MFEVLGHHLQRCPNEPNVGRHPRGGEVEVGTHQRHHPRRAVMLRKIPAQREQSQTRARLIQGRKGDLGIEAIHDEGAGRITETTGEPPHRHPPRTVGGSPCNRAGGERVEEGGSRNPPPPPPLPAARPGHSPPRARPPGHAGVLRRLHRPNAGARAGRAPPAPPSETPAESSPRAAPGPTAPRPRSGRRALAAAGSARLWRAAHAGTDQAPDLMPERDYARHHGEELRNIASAFSNPTWLTEFITCRVERKPALALR